MRHERTDRAVEAGATPLVEGALAISWWSFTPDERRGKYDFLDVYAGDRKVQICVSPARRSIRVFVDGDEDEP